MANTADKVLGGCAGFLKWVAKESVKDCPQYVKGSPGIEGSVKPTLAEKLQHPPVRPAVASVSSAPQIERRSLWSFSALTFSLGHAYDEPPFIPKLD